MRLSSQRFSGVNMPHADVNSLDSSLAERLRMNDANFSIALRPFFFFLVFDAILHPLFFSDICLSLAFLCGLLCCSSLCDQHRWQVCRFFFSFTDRRLLCPGCSSVRD